MNTDLTFITNEPGASLLNRFKVLISDARFFDSLVKGEYELEVSEKPTKVAAKIIDMLGEEVLVTKEV